MILVSEAIEHALAAGSIDRAVRLIEGGGRAAFEAGELATLLRWLEALPPDRLATSPELVWLMAWALFETGQLAAAVAMAQSHLATAAARGPAEGRLLVLLALMATVTRPDAEDLAHEGLGLVGDDTYFRSLALQAVGLRQPGARRLPCRPSPPCGEAFELARQAGHPMAVLPAVNPLGHALVLTGERGEAETLCRQVLAQYADAQGRPPPDRLVGPRRARDRPLRGQRPCRGAARVGGGLRRRCGPGDRPSDVGLGSPVPGPRSTRVRRSGGSPRGASHQ